MEESGFPGGGAEANEYFVFASPNKYDSMAKPYAAGLAFSPESLQLDVSVDPGATLYGSGGLGGGAAESARNQSSGRREANCVRGAANVGGLLRVPRS